MANVNSVRNFEKHSMHLGGKERVIQFDLNAFAELENKFGSVQQAMDELKKGRMSDVKIVLWAGLIHEEVVLDEVTGEPVKYNITPYQVGSWIKTPAMMAEVSQKLHKALGAGLPEEDEGEVKNA